MKKQLIVIFTLLLCTVFLSGCQVTYRSDTGLDVRSELDGLTRTRQIVISDAATDAKLAQFNSKDEIEQFLENLDGDSWRIAELPEDAEKECAVTLYQTETIRAGMEPEDAQMVRVCTMYTCHGSNCLTMEFPVASFTFTVSDSAAEYLHRFAQ